MERASIKDVSFVPQQRDKRLHSSVMPAAKTALSRNVTKAVKGKRKKNNTAKDQNR